MKKLCYQGNRVKVDFDENIVINLNLCCFLCKTRMREVLPPHKGEGVARQLLRHKNSNYSKRSYIVFYFSVLWER